jgi:hypothetical protein
MTTARRAADAPAIGAVRTPRHLYFFNGVGPWPSVTTVTDVLDKPALTKWQREQVARAAVQHAERLVVDREAGNIDAAIAYLLTVRDAGTDGRDRGHRIHETLESVLRREPYIVNPLDEPAVTGARAWLNERHVKPLEAEAFLIHETAGYGGTCDLIAEIDGEVWLLDWKTGKSVAWPDGRVYDEMRYQLAGYAHAEFIARPADPVRYPVPAITRFGVVHVTDAGTRLYETDVTDDDWTTFRACLWIYGQRRRDRSPGPTPRARDIGAER